MTSFIANLLLYIYIMYIIMNKKKKKGKQMQLKKCNPAFLHVTLLKYTWTYVNQNVILIFYRSYILTSQNVRWRTCWTHMRFHYVCLHQTTLGHIYSSL